MSKLLTLNINDQQTYNEYRFGNIRMAKQTDFLHYFWLALCLCHEVISISKNKQKIKKEHYDDIFVFQDPNPKPKKNWTKKLTFDPRLTKKYTLRTEEVKSHDDFKIGQPNRLLEEVKSDELLEEEEKENIHNSSKNIENDSFSISECDIDEDDELVYHGMSPDEITLVNAAKKVGYEFRYRSNKEIEIRIGGVKQVYKLLKIFPFTSDRKRMSIVVRDPNDPDFVISFTKGADNVMERLSLSEFKNHFDFSYIHHFAKKGYRTLLVGMKVIKYDEYLDWEKVYDELNNDLVNDNTEDLKQLVASIENELFLLGTTALEDKLQDNVHECIEEFRRADIKVWMITGDKLETAENVGISCRLLHEDAQRFFFTSKDQASALRVAKNTYREMKRLIRENKKAHREEG